MVAKGGEGVDGGDGPGALGQFDDAGVAMVGGGLGDAGE